MNNKVLVTGGSGMLGTSMKFFFKNAHFLNGRLEIDLSKKEETENFFKNKFYDVIIHSAAYTDLLFCDQNKDKAKFLHADIVSILQKSCNKLIYISTNPNNSKRYYYISKREGEKKTFKRKTDLVIRTNIYGSGGLVKWALSNLKSGKIINGYKDVFFNPVHVDQLSKFIFSESQNYKGLLNVGSNKVLSKFQFLTLISKNFNFDSSLIKPIEKGSDQDLTIPLNGQYVEFKLSKGITQINNFI